MTAQERLNSQYQMLCAKLGEKVIALEVLNHEIEALKTQIKALNETVPLVLSVEKAILSDAQFWHVEDKKL